VDGQTKGERKVAKAQRLDKQAILAVPESALRPLRPRAFALGAVFPAWNPHLELDRPHVEHDLALVGPVV
jgi:hypothetical protein